MTDAQERARDAVFRRGYSIGDVHQMVDALAEDDLTIIDTTELERLRTIERLVREANWSNVGNLRRQILYISSDATEALRVAVGGGE